MLEMKLEMRWGRRGTEKKNGEEPRPNQQQNYKEKYENNDHSTEKELREEKSCKLVKFSCFLSAPIEKLNFSKINQFLPKKLFQG